MAQELSFGPYIDVENGKRVVKELVFGNPVPEGIVMTTLDSTVNWMRKNSIWPMTFGLACCAIEMMSMGASRFDIARFGAEVFRPSPRQSDLMIIAGRVSQKMAPVIRQLWEQMPEPKWVISMGACATSGGVFNNYALVQSVNQVIPGRHLCPRMSAASGAVDLRDHALAGQDHDGTRHDEEGFESGASSRIIPSNSLCCVTARGAADMRFVATGARFSTAYSSQSSAAPAASSGSKPP